MKNISKYKNIYYNPDKATKILSPNYAPYKLRFWSEFFTENNIYLENNKFYLSDSDYETVFNNNKMFFEYNKRNDIMRHMNLQLKSENLMNVLYDVYVKVQNKPELMERLSERTKMYLEHFVTKPEFNSSGQMIFKDNYRPMIEGKNVVVLTTAVRTGLTAIKAVEGVQYFGGKVQ